ncbi:TIGR04211 family SH3 domain-containing protein [Haliea sp.]|uniref:TIGR04211 family SH3 domain-containing protein n=1 Tax=Haliea sp. TaxID=1932666 RepID=UPI0025C2C728|nr:TIGR04211 family SH3 domain-containing protein [Haliea sp.]
MQHFLIVSLLAILGSAAALAQDIRYISDTQYIPVRSGAGNEFRIIHRGIPSGTRLTVSRESEDGTWAEITTDGGTTGWVRSQYLMSTVPAKTLVDSARTRAEQLAEENASLTAELNQLKEVRGELESSIDSADGTLQAVTEELAQLKQISGRSLELDAENRRLVEDVENLRAQADMLGAENQRLQENLRSSAFIDGALAVLLGVVITLVVPRLWPKRRRNDGWA